MLYLITLVSHADMLLSGGPNQRTNIFVPNIFLFFFALSSSNKIRCEKNVIWNDSRKIPHFQSISSVYIGQFSCY